MKRTATDRRLDAAMARTRRRVRRCELPLVEPDTAGERQVESEQLAHRIMAAARLSDREAMVIHDRYWLEMPLWQVGECIDYVGRERARQVEQRALEKLRKAARRVCGAV